MPRLASPPSSSISRPCAEPDQKLRHRISAAAFAKVCGQKRAPLGRRSVLFCFSKKDHKKKEERKKTSSRGAGSPSHPTPMPQPARQNPYLHRTRAARTRSARQDPNPILFCCFCFCITSRCLDSDVRFSVCGLRDTASWRCWGSTRHRPALAFSPLLHLPTGTTSALYSVHAIVHVQVLALQRTALHLAALRRPTFVFSAPWQRRLLPLHHPPPPVSVFLTPTLFGTYFFFLSSLSHGSYFCLCDPT